MHLLRSILVASAVVVTACDNSLSVDEMVTTELELSSAVVGIGDTTTLRVIATNRGDRQVTAGAECGSSYGVEVRAPDGATSYPLRGLPSICPLTDVNMLEPGETDTLVVVWRVPQTVGAYTLVGGIELPSGLAARSAPKMVEVRGFTR